MATIARHQPQSFPRRYAGLALTAILFALVGGSAGWAIGHQTRNQSNAAPAVQSIAQPVKAVDVSGLTPLAPPQVSSDATTASPNAVDVATAKGGLAESIDIANAANTVAPAKGGFAESIDDANAAGVVAPDVNAAVAPGAAIDAQPAASVSARPESVYIYLVGSQEEADARTAYLADQFAEAGGASYEVRVADTPDAQAAAYTEFQQLSRIDGIDLNVVDLRPTPGFAPAAEAPQMDPTVPN